jgi:hypothetical protein
MNKDEIERFVKEQRAKFDEDWGTHVDIRAMLDRLLEMVGEDDTSAE